MNFVLQDGLLYRVKGGKKEQWVDDNRKQQEIIECFHSHATAAHYGQDKTRAKVAERFFWHGVCMDVDEFVDSCIVCQKTAQAFSIKHTTLRSILVMSKVWCRIGVDIIGPLKETPRGNKYIITSTDASSKWPDAETLPSKSALHESQFLLKCSCGHGCTDIEITDQGRELCNSVSDRLFELCGT